MIPASLNTMMLSGRLPPDFLELVGTPTTREVDNSDASTFFVPLPAHQPGDLLIVTFQTATGLGVGGQPSEGWTLLADQIYSGEGNRVLLFYKIANSSAETFVVSTRTDATTARIGMGFVFRSKTGRVPKIEVVDSGTGNTYPTLTPSAGVRKYSFLLGWFGRRPDNSVGGSVAFPSGYAKIAQSSSAYVRPTSVLYRYIRSAMGYQNLETDTTTPGAMANSGNSNYTIRISAVVWED